MSHKFHEFISDIRGQIRGDLRDKVVKFVVIRDFVSERIKKVNELLKRELGKIILKEMDFPNNVLVTLVHAQTTKDLKESKIFVSVLPEQKSDEILKNLNKKIYSLQQRLNKKLSMRPVPKIKFVQDKEPKEAQKIEELFKKIKKEDN